MFYSRAFAWVIMGCIRICIFSKSPNLLPFTLMQLSDQFSFLFLLHQCTFSTLLKICFSELSFWFSRKPTCPLFSSHSIWTHPIYFLIPFVECNASFLFQNFWILYFPENGNEKKFKKQVDFVLHKVYWIFKHQPIFPGVARAKQLPT